MSEESKKKLAFGDEARGTLLKGVDQLTDAVCVTMGPGGLNVVIQEPGRLPILTKDGVTVARAVDLPDEMENLGVQLVREAAQGAADIAGDGTTTSTVLAREMFSLGIRAMAAGNSSVLIRAGLRSACEEIVNTLNEVSRDIDTSEQIKQIGTVSANGEKDIGEYLSNAMDAVGRDGVITVEDARGFKTSLEKVSGTRIDRGFISPFFINNTSKNTCVLENARVLIANRKITSLRELLPILEHAHETQTPLLIIAEDVEGEALNGLVVNSNKGNLKVCAIRPPEFGQNRLGAIQDLSILLQAKVYSSSDDLSKISFEDLGMAKKITVKKTETVIVEPAGSEEDIEKQKETIREALLQPGLEEATQKSLTRRLSRLAGGIAIIRVGGATEAELRERKDRVEDALHATRAAVVSGILPGGGTALLRVSHELKLPEDETLHTGYKIMKAACKKPIYQIVKNAGCVPEVVIEKVLEENIWEFGFNARSQKYGDLNEMGVIDPTLVLTSALRHATSAADNLLSVACAMHEIN
jgi:chaperonin GroEL